MWFFNDLKLNLNLYDMINEKNRPAAHVINNNDGKPAANDSLSKVSIKDMLSGVKDYDGNNYFQESQVWEQFNSLS